MSDHNQQLIDGHLDCTLSPSEESQLALWLHADPENAIRFASAVMLHDRLHTLLDAGSAKHPSAPAIQPRNRVHRRLSPFNAAVASILATVILIVIGLIGPRNRPISAAILELDRIIASQAGLLGSSYQIFVEAKRTWKENGNKPRPESNRPPKPPLDMATVHVSGHQFVLHRTDQDGNLFITGRNNITSWAIRTDGPVRVSQDLDRFNHDLPGHEHDFPLTSLTDGLSLLKQSYEIRLEQQPASQLSKLVAERLPGRRGPRMVEILYTRSSGMIESLHFIDMPYGPDRLDLRMELLETHSFAPDFFDHTTHHNPDQTVLEE